MNTGSQTHRAEIQFVPQALAGAGCANLLANRRTIIPRASEISGLIMKFPGGYRSFVATV